MADECFVTAHKGGTYRCEVCDHSFTLRKGSNVTSLYLEVREGGEKEKIPIAGFVCPTCKAKSPAELVDDMNQEAAYLEEDAIKYRRGGGDHGGHEVLADRVRRTRTAGGVRE